MHVRGAPSTPAVRVRHNAGPEVEVNGYPSSPLVWVPLTRNFARPQQAKRVRTGVCRWASVAPRVQLA